MAKMRINFVVEVDAEIEITKEEVDLFNQYRAEGKEILDVDGVKEQVAECFDVRKSEVKVLSHSESIVEGKGE